MSAIGDDQRPGSEQRKLECGPTLVEGSSSFVGDPKCTKKITHEEGENEQN